MNPQNLPLLKRATWLPACFVVLALTAVFSCSRQESLYIGSYELSFQEVADAEQALRRSFPTEGDAILRAHILQFGLGEAAILHQSLPLESAKAKEDALLWAKKIRSEGDFKRVFALWAEETGGSSEANTIVQPNPASMGAPIAASVALLEDGEWNGPIASSLGWELVFLEKRFDGPRNRAQIATYRMLFPVGTPTDHAQAKKDWDTLPLRGNPELLNALPQSFRHNRLAPEPE